MSAIIDEFVATLGLDGTLYNRGMRDATRSQERLSAATTRGNSDRERQERQLSNNQARRQKEQDSRVKSTVEGYRKIRNELLSLAAIFTAGVGIKDFITKTINDAAGLGYLSKNLQMTTQQLTAYQRASERAGGSGDGIIAQLKESQDTLAQLKSGMGPNEGLQNFFRFGGNSDDLKDGNTYLLARSRIIHDMFAVDPGKAALIAKSMGISDDQFNFLKQGPAAVNELVKAQEKNAAITMKDAEAALHLKNKMLDLRDSLQSTATRIILQLAPTIELMFAKLEKGAAWVVEHKDDIAQWVQEGIKWMGKAVDAVDRLATRYEHFFDSPMWNIATAPAVMFFKAISQAVDLAVIGVEKLMQLSEKFGVSSTIKSLVDKFMGGSRPPASAPSAPSAAPAGASRGSGGTRGIRNNNPGNIEYGAFTKARGATGSDGRFAQFGTPQEGISAMSDLLRSYGSRGINSVDAIVSRYAPGHENNTGAYSSAVSRKLGVKGSDKLNMDDPAVMKKLVAAMIQQENGSNPYSDDVMSAATMSKSQRFANASAAGRMPSGASASAAGRLGNVSNSTSDVRIEKIEIHTAATDTAKMAQELRPAIEKHTFANQANSGMQ